ncbi:MAG: stage II sporulation protein E [Marinilabiliales bacterium]|nr:MAG: stage II sporulation protein E [Marinilabiliales bacterium]
MENSFYVEVGYQQKNHGKERICGDVFLSQRVKEENRIVAVLSDGMGHGVKANILATLTASMALNFTREHKDVTRIAEIIMNTLPVCSQRKISYSTFTAVDIEMNAQTSILEYDNPGSFIMRESKPLDSEWKCLILSSEKNKGKEIKSCHFNPRKEDRIIICSDGITQSGMGSKKYPFGWGRENVQQFITGIIEQQPDISAQKLASRIINTAYKNDNYNAQDDTSCAVIYFREPRKLLLCSGPPFENENDTKLADIVKEYPGKKILSGGTTGDIVARELGLEIKDTFEFTDPDLPPVSHMDGIDLVTEGILTLSKVSKILNEHNQSWVPGKGPADQIASLLLESDEIRIIIGTRINIAHQDPNLPVELEIRRTVLKRVARKLEEKFLKEVTVEYI